MSGWNYRVVRHPEGWMGIHEVYYGDGGEPCGCTADPVTFLVDDEEGVEGLIGSLQRAVHNAQTRPILEAAAFPWNKPVEVS